MVGEMEEEEFNLKWSGYSDHLTQVLQDLMMNQTFTDVTLVCDDKVQLKAHKIVLTSSSGFFQSILTDVIESNHIIYMRNVNHQEMEAVLKFMYLGEASFMKERSKEFIKVALDLELKAICQDVEENLPKREGCSKNQDSERDTHMISKGYSRVNEHETNLEKNRLKVNLPKPEKLGTLMSSKNENVNQMLKTNEQYSNFKPNVEEFDTVLAKPNATETILYDNEQVGIDHVKLVKCMVNIQTVTENLDLNNVDPNISRIEPNENTKPVVDPTKNSYLCLACNIPFVTKAMLWTHCQKYHKGVPNMCNKCGHRATDSIELKKHKIAVHNYRTCTKCKFIAFTPATVEDHIKEVHEGFKIKCGECDFESGRRQLQLHRSEFHGTVEKEPHSCKKCEFETFSLKELSKHMNRQHKDKSMLFKFSCEKCKYYTTTKGFLNQHLSKHSNSELEEKYSVNLVEDEKKIYYCNDCEYQNPVYGNLKRHVEVYHLGIKYQCDQCGYAATRPENLTKHIESKHLKLHKWKCEQCDKTFIYRPTLKVHIDTVHLGIKFPCTLCKSEFNIKGNLTKHMKVYHSVYD